MRAVPTGNVLATHGAAYQRYLRALSARDLPTGVRRHVAQRMCPVPERFLRGGERDEPLHAVSGGVVRECYRGVVPGGRVCPM